MNLKTRRQITGWPQASGRGACLHLPRASVPAPRLPGSAAHTACGQREADSPLTSVKGKENTSDSLKSSHQEGEAPSAPGPTAPDSAHLPLRRPLRCPRPPLAWLGRRTPHHGHVVPVPGREGLILEPRRRRAVAGWLTTREGNRCAPLCPGGGGLCCPSPRTGPRSAGHVCRSAGRVLITLHYLVRGSPKPARRVPASLSSRPSQTRLRLQSAPCCPPPSGRPHCVPGCRSRQGEGHLPVWVTRQALDSPSGERLRSWERRVKRPRRHPDPPAAPP